MSERGASQFQYDKNQHLVKSQPEHSNRLLFKSSWAVTWHLTELARKMAYACQRHVNHSEKGTTLSTINVKPTKADVRAAIRAYEKGVRPFRFTTPRSWYLVGAGQTRYPLKYIYALVVNRAPSSFNTSEPLRELPLLGFDVQREPKDENADFDSKVRAAMKDPQARAARLAKALPKPPRLYIRQSIVFDRNPDVVAEVLSQANGLCWVCKKKAPFLRKDRTPYLEVHHITQLANGGDDTVENAKAVCPNCHRQAHHGELVPKF